MKRTPLQRKTPLRAKAPMRRKSRSRSTPVRVSARGQDCTLQFPGCRNDRETVVLAHLRMFGGGGVGMKPSDLEGVYACAWCHDRADGRVNWIRTEAGQHFDYWESIARALVRTHRALHAAGIVKIKGEENAA